MDMTEKYIFILSMICRHYSIEPVNFLNILKDKDNKYLFLLLLKKYKCIDENKIKEDLKLKNKRSLTYNLKRAEERLLINSAFREKFFEIEEDLLKHK
ncbi:MAG: hypothetical protein GX275_03925 [Clostridiales bacterium]|mgnify:CR=1 FL=1|nr:hypothetical protein [Clostridiales bacterium]